MTMIGATIVHKNEVYTTHTTLPTEHSAVITATRKQKIVLLGIVVVVLAAFLIFPLPAAIVTVAVLSLIYFLDMIFNLTTIIKSLKSNPEIKVTANEIKELENLSLPKYTILCPLYKEANVLPQFVYAMTEIDWPKNKLEVLLLLEEKDRETIVKAQSIKLPYYIKTIIVPDSLPQTKPKACNYGLAFARGDYLVVYDAEDKPDPLQLKKAYLSFQKVGRNVRCLQAKLNFFNPNQNLLTKLFTAEYSLWFDLILPGLQSMQSYIPLGGTSNHFRTKDLRKLKGWDPFNVTEDCDLGARIFNQGFQTAIIDSTTYEEANSNLKNWLRQRSRWIKGYIQTYLVHMRHPIKFYREKGVDAFIFQQVIGSRVIFLLINPILWLLTAAYFVMRQTLGPAIDSIYPPPILYLAVSSLVVGNFLHAYYYMIGCARRSQWDLIKYVYLIPFYWFLASISALIAFYQLVVRPHYWEKTIHGLNLSKNNLKFSPLG